MLFRPPTSSLPNRATGRAKLREWLPIAGLLALSVVPVVGGLARLGSLADGVELIPVDPRTLAHPAAIAVHVVSVSIWCVLGAFQFSARIRRHRPLWHRSAGWLLVLSGLVTAGSGMWLTHVYPPGELDGPWLYWMRMVVSTAMAVCIARGVCTILRREIRSHRAWMTRAYALALGAGTQVFTHIPFLLIEDFHTETGRNIAMGAGWAINALVAEWALRRRTPQRAPRPAAANAAAPDVVPYGPLARGPARTRTA